MSRDRNDLWQGLLAVLARYTSKIVAKLVVEEACWRCRTQPERLRAEDLPKMMPELETKLRLFLKQEATLKRCLVEIETLPIKLRASGPFIPEELQTTMPVTTEVDVLKARLAAREICALLGFSRTEETKVATVVSELTRNILLYAGSGSVSLHAIMGERRGIQVVVEDKGPGIPNLPQIMAGQHRSRNGMGLGLTGSKNLMDEFAVETAPGAGTRITTSKYRM